MATIQDAIKPELSPSYVLEVPELEGVGVEGIKTVYRLRNLISRHRRGLAPDVKESPCWSEMEKVFAG
jgi:hypothetical protein